MLALQIARRYLIAKKSQQAINIVSIVSVVGVMVGTMGLIIVLSVFNGFGNLVLQLYDAFDPDIKITSVYSKTFLPDSAGIEKIKQVEGISYLIFTLEENALLRYREKQTIATVKGVSEDFLKSTMIANKLIDGSAILQNGDSNFAIVGGQIAYVLGLHPEDPFHSIGIYMPKRNVKLETALDPSSAFVNLTIHPSGVFAIQQDFDSKYVIVPLRFARELIGHEQNISAIEITVKKGVEIKNVKAQVSQITGNHFDVKDRYQQHDFLYKIINSEKVAVFLILGFILLIATFNIVGSLTMLIIEKKKDIAMLLSMGAEIQLVKRIFFLEGLLISLSGAMSGLLLGWFVCWLQLNFGFIKLEHADAFVVDAYPVLMQPLDFIYVFITVFTIGAMASWYTSWALVKKQVPSGFTV